MQAQAHPASTGDLKDKSEKPAKKKRKTKRKKAGDDLVQPHTQEDAEAGQETQKRKHHDVDTAGSTNITSNTSSELPSNPANFNVAKKRKLGPGGVSNSNVVEKPSASAVTLDPVTSEGHATDGYGEPVHLPAPQKGLCAYFELLRASPASIRAYDELQIQLAITLTELFLSNSQRGSLQPKQRPSVTKV